MVKKLFEKYQTLSLPLKAAIWFTICNFALKGISFICMPIYTRFLSTEEYGRLSVITSYETIFTIIATGEIYLGAHQRGILKYKDNVNIFDQSIVLFSNILTVFTLIIVFIFRKPFTQFTGVSFGLYSLMSLYFLVYAPYNCWLNKKRFVYDYKAAVFITLFMTLVANFFPIFMLSIFGKTANVKISSTLFYSILVCFPFWIKYFHPGNFINKWQKVKEYLIFVIKFQGPLVFHSLSYYILNQSDRIMIEKFSDGSKVAFYSVAYSFATVVILIQNSLNQVLKPWRYQALEDERFDDVKKLSNITVAVVGTGIVCFMLVAPEAFKLLFPQRYYESIVCIPPITMGVFFLFLYSIFVDVESYYGRTNYIAYVSCFSAILNIILNYLGMKVFSYVVCAYTTLLCYALMSFLHFLFMKRTCKNAGIISMPIDSRFIWRSSIVLTAIFVGINFFYSSIVFRYLLFAVILFFFYLKRNLLKSVIDDYRHRGERDGEVSRD